MNTIFEVICAKVWKQTSTDARPETQESINRLIFIRLITYMIKHKRTLWRKTERLFSNSILVVTFSLQNGQTKECGYFV